MSSVSKSLLKAKMLEYFRVIEETGEELIVTDNNRPVLRVSPYTKRKSAAETFGDIRGQVRYDGDLLAPTTDEWPKS
jgi:antitoxin (DNA-binding transcriptional repressor) of toxin-antitoxin stability system